MTFRVVHNNGGPPFSLQCDTTVEFRSGMIAQLTVMGNQIMATVSSGSAPLGIIDDERTRAFTAVSWDEIVIVPVASALNGNNELASTADAVATLDHPSIVENSFTSDVSCTLNSNNGVVTFIAGTRLNYSTVGGTYDAIRAVVSYTYYVPNIPGDDSTHGSGRITIWYNRMIFQTDQFETNQPYVVNMNLYVSENGILTSRRPSDRHPAVGIVTAPPNATNGMLEVFWF